MKTLIVFALLLTPVFVFASPYLVSDPSVDATVDSCTIEGITLPCVLDATRAVHIDLQSLPAGSYTVTAKFCAGVWCSDASSPFAFVRPAQPVRPVNIKLTK
jgi:hypothetical protein